MQIQIQNPWTVKYIFTEVEETKGAEVTPRVQSKTSITLPLPLILEWSRLCWLQVLDTQLN